VFGVLQLTQFTTIRDEMTLQESNGPKRFYAGVDIGSRYTKVVIVTGLGMVSKEALPTGNDVVQTANMVLKSASEKVGLRTGEIKCLVGTGYGRVSLSFADMTLTELSCHARGCFHLNNKARTVIDIGGQDSKVLHLDSNGNMVDFVMNDKCAAGTGRFLEVAATSLEVDMETMSAMARVEQPCPINSMCVVFAETEIISLLSKGESIAAIISGINRGFSQRIGNMVKRLGVKGQCMFVGGVAKNKGLSKELESYLGVELFSPSIDPQYTGALGAALMAQGM
jgi:predicted CoA-substrate-specific enzyme activase